MAAVALRPETARGLEVCAARVNAVGDQGAGPVWHVDGFFGTFSGVNTALQWSFKVALTLALVSGVSPVHADGTEKAQPHSGTGLPLVMTVLNPSGVDVTLFRFKGGEKQMVAVIHKRTQLAVDTLPGERFVAFFPCGGRQSSHKVPRVIAHRWKLPSKPCG